MKINRALPPTTVEREISIDFSRDEIIALIVRYARDKIGPNLKLDDLSVHGDDNGKLESISIAGVEILPITWPTPPTQTTPPAIAQTPTPSK